MKIIIVVIALESLAITLWMTVLFYARNRKPDLAGLLTSVSSLSNVIPPSDSAALLNAARWTFINGWQAEAQANDRRPVQGAHNGSSSDARREHQLRYKEWSKERHD